MRTRARTRTRTRTRRSSQTWEVPALPSAPHTLLALSVDLGWKGLTGVVSVVVLWCCCAARNEEPSAKSKKDAKLASI